MKKHNLKNDMVYLVSPCGLGDTMILCGYEDALKEKYGCDICYLIKESHKCILDMYGIINYIVINYDESELRQLANSNSVIEKGQLFVAHPSYSVNKSYLSDFYSCKTSFWGLYKAFLGLEDTVKCKEPKFYPEISDNLNSKLGDMNILEAVLIAPEMNSYFFKKNINSYFEKEIDKQIRIGNTVILNCINEQYADYQNLKIELSLVELIAVAIRCKKVISVRSGFTDLIYYKVKDMDVIYPSKYYWNMYRQDIDFGARTCVKSKIAERKNLLKVCGYTSCAIYGMGYIGNCVWQELQAEGFQIDYVVDRRAREINLGEIKMYCPDEVLPVVDVVIVAVENETEIIMEQIERKYGLKTINYRFLFDAN